MMDDVFVPLPGVLKLVSHEVRWNLLQLLSRSDYRVQELVERLNLPQNLVSYHLKRLREGHLVTEHRSDADERAIFYSLDVELLQAGYSAAGETLHPAVVGAVRGPERQDEVRRQAPLRVLFLCTENSARSQMAEALMRHLSRGTVEAYSAGSRPAERVHPLARRCLEEHGIPLGRAVPKHIDIFEGLHFDAIVTVCDRVRESCPVFPGDPQHVHWSFLDPATVQGTEAERLRAFEQISLQLTTRLRLFLPILARKKSSTRES